MTETADMPPSPETQIAMLNERMGHLLERIEHVSSQQDVLIGLAKSVAVHDNRLEGLEDRQVAIEGRLADNTSQVSNQLHDISKQITEASRVTDDKTARAITRVHERLNEQDKTIQDANKAQDDRITAVENDIATAKGVSKTFGLISGLVGAVLLASVGWVFKGVNDAHDMNIRQDEHIRVIEQHIDKLEGKK